MMAICSILGEPPPCTPAYCMTPADSEQDRPWTHANAFRTSFTSTLGLRAMYFSTNGLVSSFTQSPGRGRVAGMPPAISARMSYLNFEFETKNFKYLWLVFIPCLRILTSTNRLNKRLPRLPHARRCIFLLRVVKNCGSSGFRVGSIPLLRLRGGRESYEILTK